MEALVRIYNEIDCAAASVFEGNFVTFYAGECAAGLVYNRPYDDVSIYVIVDDQHHLIDEFANKLSLRHSYYDELNGGVYRKTIHGVNVNVFINSIDVKDVCKTLNKSINSAVVERDHNYSIDLHQADFSTIAVLYTIRNFGVLPTRTHIIHKRFTGVRHIWPKHSSIGDLDVFAAPWAFSCSPDHYSVAFWDPYKGIVNKDKPCYTNIDFSDLSEEDLQIVIDSFDPYNFGSHIVQLYKYLAYDLPLATSTNISDWWWWIIYWLGTILPEKTSKVSRHIWRISDICNISINRREVVSSLSNVNQSVADQFIKSIDTLALYIYRIYTLINSLAKDGYVRYANEYRDTLRNYLRILPSQSPPYDVTLKEFWGEDGLADLSPSEKYSYYRKKLLIPLSNKHVYYYSGLDIENVYIASLAYAINYFAATPADVASSFVRAKNSVAQWARIPVDQLEGALKTIDKLHRGFARAVNHRDETYLVSLLEA